MEFINKDGEVRCVFSGRMDTTQCLEAERDVMHSIEGARQIVFDLKDVDYIASSFLRLCGKASYRVGSGNFSIVNADIEVRKIFSVAGLAERLNVI